MYIYLSHQVQDSNGSVVHVKMAKKNQWFWLSSWMIELHSVSRCCAESKSFCKPALSYLFFGHNIFIFPFYKKVKLTRTLTKSERAPLRVCHYDRCFSGDDLKLFPLTPKCIDIFLSPSCINVWNMKAAHWKLVQLSCQNQSVDKVQLWPWPFDPKMYRYRPNTILHLCMKYESCTLKTGPVIVSEAKCWQSSVLTLTFDLLTPKCIGIFLSPSYIYVWNIKAVHWKLVQLSCQNQSVDKVQLWPWPLTFWPQNV